MKINFNTMKISVILLASLSFLIPSIVIAGNRYQDQIRGQLILAATALGLGNYELSHDPYINSLRANSTNHLRLNLRSGKSYAVVGVCDEDCSDIDLKIYDDNQNLIDTDSGTDDYPMVQVSPTWSGEFSVEVRMYDCSASDCYYGIGVFSQ